MRPHAPLAAPALNHTEPVADAGHCDAMSLVRHCDSQVVGLGRGIRSTATVPQDYKVDFAEALGVFEATFALLVAQGERA